MIFDFIRQLAYKWKFRGRGIRIHRTARVRRGSELEGLNYIWKNTIFRGTLGRGSYIGADCGLQACIGRYSSIAPGVKSNPGIHTYKAPFATTSPMFFNRAHNGGHSYANHDVIDNFRFIDEDRRFDVEIGNDCWIGQNVFFAGGTHIGDGAVVLAGAVVTKNVEPYAIVGGVPAKTVGYRYDPETIAFLKEIKWWNFPEEWLKNNWMLLNDIEKLKKYPGIKELAEC